MKSGLRYQYCTWPTKLWRCRYLLPVPYFALRGYIWGLVHGEYETLGFHWSLARGMADLHMNHMYDWENIKSELLDSRSEE